MRNPGKTSTVYQVAEHVGEAWTNVAIPCNITAWFTSSGIWSFERIIFRENVFLPCSVTDRPVPVPPTQHLIIYLRPQQLKTPIPPQVPHIKTYCHILMFLVTSMCMLQELFRGMGMAHLPHIYGGGFGTGGGWVMV